MDAVSGLTRDVLDRARRSRDARFDGRFFIAVRSTRIYCRPICPSRLSNDSNVRYYATAAEAQEAGFRPCLRCRPEAAPGSPAWLGTSAVVKRALVLIQDGGLDRESLSKFSERLGVGARHLTRLFAQHVGVSPAAVAQTRRLHLAKRLLDDTNLAITDVALAAGFSSIRRFNDAFHATYHRSPRDLRKGRHMEAGADAAITVRLAYRPPYDWEQMSRFLAVRAIPGLESVSGSYVRAVRTRSGHAVVRVQPVPGEHILELRIWLAMPAELPQLISAARRVFDLAADPEKIQTTLLTDPLLRPLISRRPGLRIPGVWDLFECGVRTIFEGSAASRASRAALSSLVQHLGERIPIAEGHVSHLFPTPEVLATADLGRFTLSVERREALHRWAQGVRDRAIRLDAPEDELTRQLCELPGVGRARGGYFELRGFGELDAFPCSDLKLRRVLSAGGKPLTAAQLEARAEKWRPFRGYAALHLWQSC